MEQAHGSSQGTPPMGRYDRNPAPEFKPKKVIVLTKITRYEYEKKKYAHLDDEALARYVSMNTNYVSISLVGTGSKDQYIAPGIQSFTVRCQIFDFWFEKRSDLLNF